MTKVYFGGDRTYREVILRAMEQAQVTEANEIDSLTDIIYWVYGGGPELKFHWKLWTRRSPLIVLHWIGTDVTYWTHQLTKGSFKATVYYRIWRYLINRKKRQGRLINLVCADWLGKELKEVGIAATTMPITSIHKDLVQSSETEIPRTIDFISYVPFERFAFYGGDQILELAARMPERSFRIIHPDLEQLNELQTTRYPPNVTASAKLSFHEMQQLIMASKCFLRFTLHDGLSLSVLEALLHRNQVFWTHPFVHTCHVNFSEENMAAIALRMEHSLLAWKPNNEGRAYVIHNFSSEQLAAGYTDLLKKLKN
jgi:hypothetical protein